MNNTSSAKPKELSPKVNEQKMLLEIVETWRPSEFPEYRGFRCANCQEYKNEAWYHWVNTGNDTNNYKLPIHMCNDNCEPHFQAGTLDVDQSKRTVVDIENFGKNYQYSERAKKRFTEIINSWPDYKKPELKTYSCDDCGNDLDIDDSNGQREGYHVWWKMDDEKTLAELHFHRDCGHNLDIFTKEELNENAKR